MDKTVKILDMPDDIKAIEGKQVLGVSYFTENKVGFMSLVIRNGDLNIESVGDEPYKLTIYDRVLTTVKYSIAISSQGFLTWYESTNAEEGNPVTTDLDTGVQYRLYFDNGNLGWEVY